MVRNPQADNDMQLFIQLEIEPETGKDYLNELQQAVIAQSVTQQASEGLFLMP